MPRSNISPRSKHILYLMLLVTVFVVWLVFLVAERPSDGLGTDFYPIYYAGQLLGTGIDPYGPEATAHLMEVWNVPFAPAGFAYPLPAVVAVWPLVLLPLPLAVVVWTVSGTIGTAAAIRLQPDGRSVYRAASGKATDRYAVRTGRSDLGLARAAASNLVVGCRLGSVHLGYELSAAAGLDPGVARQRGTLQRNCATV
jgi:hypothetical protein